MTVSPPTWTSATLLVGWQFDDDPEPTGVPMDGSTRLIMSMSIFLDSILGDIARNLASRVLIRSRTRWFAFYAQNRAPPAISRRAPPIGALRANQCFDHRPGDRPDDPPDPQAHTHVVRFELAAETFARLRQARTVLDSEHGTNLSDDAFVAALCSGVLDGAMTTETAGRAKYQIAVTVCQRCRQGWQEGAGAQIAIEPAAIERAMCDAQHIGSIDSTVPERAYQDIPPSTARLVWRRDGGRCRVPVGERTGDPSCGPSR